MAITGDLPRLLLFRNFIVIASGFFTILSQGHVADSQETRYEICHGVPVGVITMGSEKETAKLLEEAKDFHLSIFSKRLCVNSSSGRVSKELIWSM